MDRVCEGSGWNEGEGGWLSNVGGVYIGSWVDG